MLKKKMVKNRLKYPVEEILGRFGHDDPRPISEDQGRKAVRINLINSVLAESDLGFVSKYIFVKLAFPFGDGAGDSDVPGNVCECSHHVEQAIERENKGDDQEGLFGRDPDNTQHGCRQQQTC